jgi:hypothetical protein
MMSLFRQVRKLAPQKPLFVTGIKTSHAVFLHFCCRYSDSFIDIYHGVSDFIACRQQASDLMVMSRRVS